MLQLLGRVFFPAGIENAAGSSLRAYKCLLAYESLWAYKSLLAYESS